MEGRADVPIISYAADFLTRYGIAYEADGPRARVIVPSSRRFAYLASELIVPTILIIYAAGSGISIIFTIRTGGVSVFWSSACGIAQSLFVVVTFGASAYVGIREWVGQLRRKIVFEVDEDRLTIHDHSSSGEPRSRSWDWNHVGGVTVGPVPWNAGPSRGLGLHIRITGKTILEIMPGHSREIAQWVADRLNEALGSRRA